MPTLDSVIKKTLAYADVFDYPLTAKEAHRYLVDLRASLEAVQACLDKGCGPDGWAERKGILYALRGRMELAQVRRAREQTSSRLWPLALRYGQRIARMPFVRMVAVTGSLAMENVEDPGDIDYFIVTSPGRLWICRAILVLCARLPAALSRIRLCLNYLVTETKSGLTFPEQNLYTAHEVAQMVPVAGLDVYTALRAQNPWVLDFLPNAGGAPPRATEEYPRSRSKGVIAVERLLSLPAFDRLESLEMRRKIAILRRRGPSDEAAFSADWCKGHFDGHEKHTLQAYEGLLSPDE